MNRSAQSRLVERAKSGYEFMSQPSMRRNGILAGVPVQTRFKFRDCHWQWQRPESPLRGVLIRNPRGQYHHKIALGQQLRKHCELGYARHDVSRYSLLREDPVQQAVTRRRRRDHGVSRSRNFGQRHCITSNRGVVELQCQQYLADPTARCIARSIVCSKTAN